MKFYYFVDKEGVRQGPLSLDDLHVYDIFTKYNEDTCKVEFLEQHQSHKSQIAKFVQYMYDYMTHEGKVDSPFIKKQ